jgi:hypothetical protein
MSQHTPLSTPIAPVKNNRVRTTNILTGVGIVIGGLMAVSWILGALGVFDRAARRFLADNCMYPIDSSVRLSSTQLSDELEKCRQFRGLSLSETLGMYFEYVGFLPVLMLLAVCVGGIGHVVISRRVLGISAGEWAERRRAVREATAANSSVSAAIATSAPAAWHPDPLHRYEWRYFDGNQWTSHVSTNGIQAQDPISSP